MTQDRETDTSPVCEPTRVLCVDDNSDITAVMRMVIETDAGLICVGCLASADRLISEVRGMNQQPHVILLDATMPGTSPLDVMRDMAAEMPTIRTIVYSGHTDSAFIDRVMNLGAWGYVSKNDDPATILQAVHVVAAGSVWWPPSGHNA
jgi:DNA-binding NarL/FixJ family response regulator